jgi:formylglycine-generating enzyme required for sulfatase activity
MKPYIVLIACLIVGPLRNGVASDDTVGNNPGDVFRDCPNCPEMVVVPSGSFLMGDIAGGGFSTERPVHRVTIPEAFAVGRYEVTVGQFREFADETSYRTEGGCHLWTGVAWEIDSSKSWQDPGFNQSDQHPVGCMNWDDAEAYAIWLARKAGQSYRLLSEAEWEYAQRAGAATLWSHGNDETGICRYGNIRDDTYRSNTDDTAGAQCDDGSITKAPVGSYQPNEFGLYDMTGNVYEWTQDCWNDSYSGSPTNGSAWMSGDCSRHTLRGGSWPSRPRGLRSAFRNKFETGNRSNNFGFRVARPLSPQGVLLRGQEPSTD